MEGFDVEGNLCDVLLIVICCRDDCWNGGKCGLLMVLYERKASGDALRLDSGLSSKAHYEQHIPLHSLAHRETVSDLICYSTAELEG